MQDESWQNFLDKCLQLKNKQDMATFFDVFLTMSEKEELGKRFNIIQELLKNNKTQREIARDLKVSIANVSRGSNVLKTYPETIRKILV